MSIKTEVCFILPMYMFVQKAKQTQDWVVQSHSVYSSSTYITTVQTNISEPEGKGDTQDLIKLHSHYWSLYWYTSCSTWKILEGRGVMDSASMQVLPLQCPSTADCVNVAQRRGKQQNLYKGIKQISVLKFSVGSFSAIVFSQAVRITPACRRFPSSELNEADRKEIIIKNVRMRKTFLPCLLRVLGHLSMGFSTTLVPCFEVLDKSKGKQKSFC